MPENNFLFSSVIKTLSKDAVNRKIKYAIDYIIA